MTFLRTDDILSLIIPAYNEAERLPAMLDVTLHYLKTNRTELTHLFHAIGERSNCGDMSSKSTPPPMRCEFIIVNDGSTDDTENVVEIYAKKVMNGDIVKLISMHANCGKGVAVKTGMLHSSGQLCLMVDADGATDISDGLPKVLHEMKNLFDGISRRRSDSTNISAPCFVPAAVFGSRAHLEDESTASRSKIRTFLMHSFHFFVKLLCSPRIKDTQCGFKLFTRSAAVMLFTNLHLRRW
jgi:dolichyl-phosphate beta-glucosyltransferase